MYIHILSSNQKTILEMLESDKSLLPWLHKTIDAKRYRCCHCGKDKIPESYYHIKQNKIYKDGRLPICKKCINELYIYYCGKYNSSSKAMQKICSLFDLYFDWRLFGSDEMDTCAVGRYIQKLNLRQNKYKLARGFDGSVYGKYKLYEKAKC